MKNKRLFRTLLVGGCIFALSTGAYAQEVRGPAQPGRVGEQIRLFDPAADNQPQINIPEVRIEGAPDGADQVRFVLKDLQIEGVSAYSQADLAPLYQGDIGQTITLNRLYAIAADLTRKYRNDGYIISQTVVPAQTIDGGTARLLVVEGTLDQVIVEGGVSPESEAQIQAIASKLKASQPLKAADLERYLLIINDMPGVSARSIIGPSATETGKADLRILLNNKMADFLLGVDNYGSAYLGPWQFTGAAKVNNLLGLNDSLLVQMVTAPTDNELYYFYGAYEQPIFDEGTVLSFDVTHTDSEPGHDLEIFGAQGFSTTFGANLKHPFIRSRNENLTGRVRLDAQNSSTKNLLGVSTEDVLRSVRVGARYELLSTFVGTSVNMVDVQLSKGLDILGASQENDAGLSRADGDPEYTKFEAEITRLQRLVQGFNLLVGVKGQVASNPLLSPEEFGVGGMSAGYGRGYDPSEVTGDDGVAAKVELQWNAPFFENSIESMQFFGFYDVGTVWNKDATTSADKRNSIASTGLGVRTRITPAISADATLAFPLTEDVATENDDDPRLFFSLTSRF